MKRAAEGLLNDLEPRVDRRGDERPHRVYRVAHCQRSTSGGPVEGWRSPDGLHSMLKGLQQCGSVWHCPLCAPGIAAGRREEMNRAIAAQLQDGGDVYFVTYTLQHTAAKFGQGKLAAELVALGEALSRLKGLRVFCRLMADVDALGAIRALEPTYGEINGWHAHTHELIFARPGVLELLRKIGAIWAELLIKRDLAGLIPGEPAAERERKLAALRERCFTVQPGAFAAEYVSKYGREPEGERGAWGIASEMTRSHLKRGRGIVEGIPQRCSHANPWGLLNDFVDGDRRSGLLWREFAQCFQGKRQLYWSPGLRAHFGIDRRTDEQLAAEQPAARCTEFVGEVSGWHLVLGCDARHELLQAVRAGYDAVRTFLAGLAHSPPSHGIEHEIGSWSAWVLRDRDEQRRAA